MRACCVICSDLFDDAKPVVAVPCGHVFHSECLVRWLDHGNTCPECRLRIARKSIFRLYFNIASHSSLNSSSLENEIENLKADMKARDAALEACEKEKETMRLYVIHAETQAEELRQMNYKHESEIAKLNAIVKSLSKLEGKVQTLEQRNRALFNDLEHLSNVQKIVTGTQKEVQEIIQGCGTGPEAIKQLATYCSLLKRELNQVIDDKQKLKCDITTLKKEFGLKSLALKEAKEQINVLKDRVLCIEKESGPCSKVDTPTLHSPEMVHSSCVCKHAVCLRGKNLSTLNVTPISVPFDDKKKRKLDIVVQNKSVKTLPTSIIDASVSSSKLHVSDVQKRDENSIMRTGYNGLGGHCKFISQSKDLRAIEFLRKNKKIS